MILGSLSPKASRAAVFAAALAFAIGVLAGATIGSAPAARNAPVDAERETAPPVTYSAAMPKGAYAAEVLRVGDGDTFEARIHVWPGIEITTKVRLRGVDAPEFKARCPEERDKAEAARQSLAAMLAQGDVSVARIGLDKYGGRVLADAATRHIPNVSEALLSKGVVRPYDGGRREAWCVAARD